MISDGYAFEYTYDLPYRYPADFKTAGGDLAPRVAGCGAGRLSAMRLGVKVAREVKVAPGEENKVKEDYPLSGAYQPLRLPHWLFHTPAHRVVVV
jgi:hypothetical protein